MGDCSPNVARGVCTQPTAECFSCLSPSRANPAEYLSAALRFAEPYPIPPWPVLGLLRGPRRNSTLTPAQVRILELPGHWRGPQGHETPVMGGRIDTPLSPTEIAKARHALVSRLADEIWELVSGRARYAFFGFSQGLILTHTLTAHPYLAVLSCPIPSLLVSFRPVLSRPVSSCPISSRQRCSFLTARLPRRWMAGSMLSYLLCEELLYRGAAPPLTLFAAGRGAPHAINAPRAGLRTMQTTCDEEMMQALGHCARAAPLALFPTPAPPSAALFQP